MPEVEGPSVGHAVSGTKERGEKGRER